MATSEQIEELLPQTQCRQCGFDGCKPYAIALSKNATTINLCLPGGEVVMNDLAHLLNKPPLGFPAEHQSIKPKAIAIIDEQECIGCTACIKACPVDAILGTGKKMHTVFPDECTGCELCIAPCPVDCIDMQPVNDPWLPRSRSLLTTPKDKTRQGAATQARLRFQHKQKRQQQQAIQRQQYLETKKKKLTQLNTSISNQTTQAQIGKIDSNSLIARATAKAKTQHTHIASPRNQQDYQQQKIKNDQKKAMYRRAVHDLKYGSAEEKSNALIYLKEYKIQQQEHQK